MNKTTGLFKALRHFDIPIMTFMETDCRLSDSQRIGLILVSRAVRQARRKIARKEGRRIR